MKIHFLKSAEPTCRRSGRIHRLGGIFQFHLTQPHILRLPEMAVKKKQMSPKNFERLVLFSKIINSIIFGVKLLVVPYVLSGLMWTLQNKS